MKQQIAAKCVVKQPGNDSDDFMNDFQVHKRQQLKKQQQFCASEINV
jgi:hypothetical protein